MIIRDMLVQGGLPGEGHSAILAVKFLLIREMYADVLFVVVRRRECFLAFGALKLFRGVLCLQPRRFLRCFDAFLVTYTFTGHYTRV